MLVAIVLIIITSPLIAWFTYWYFKVQYFEKYLKNIPGPRGIPLFGSALELASPTILLPSLMKWCNTYKTNFKVYVGGQAYFYIIEPKDLEFILNSTTILTKSDMYSFFVKWLGLGLLISTVRRVVIVYYIPRWKVVYYRRETRDMQHRGELNLETGTNLSDDDFFMIGSKWQKHRKIITPAFHFQILEEFIDVFNAESEILVSIWKNESKKGSINLYPFIARCTLDIICETAMGTSVNAQKSLDSEYVKSVNLLFEIIVRRSFSIILRNDILYSFTEDSRREKHALQVVHDFTKSVIRRRKDEFFSNSNNYGRTTDNVGIKKRRAFLDLLLEYSTKDSSFTEESICEEVDTFMLEGHDTTATAITFTLYALATYPDIQKKVYEEIQNIFSDDPKRTATYTDFQEMKYLEMVIKEALRIYTIVPQIGRVLEKDVDWNGLLLPKGLMITIFLYGISNSSKLYENPEKFDPERFNPKNSKLRNPFSYIPFSAGPRNCIGQRFAMFEMKSAISHILRNFELLPDIPEHNVRLLGTGVLKPANGVYIRLKNRE